MLSAGQASASCIQWTCFCLESESFDASQRGSAIATLETSFSGSNRFRIISTRGLTGVVPGDVVTSETPHTEVVGTPWVLFFTSKQLWHQHPVTWMGTVSCQQSPKPVWLTVERAQELFERPDCYEQLQRAGLTQPPCNDTSRLCFGSQSMGGVMVGLSALWLRRRRVRTRP